MIIFYFKSFDKALTSNYDENNKHPLFFNSGMFLSILLGKKICIKSIHLLTCHNIFPHERYGDWAEKQINKDSNKTVG